MPQGLWVRVPLPVPRRRGRHIVRGDFFQKSPLTHFVAAPLQIEPAALGFDLVLGANPDAGGIHTVAASFFIFLQSSFIYIKRRTPSGVSSSFYKRFSAERL